MLTRSPGLLDRTGYPNAAAELVAVPPLVARTGPELHCARQRAYILFTTLMSLCRKGEFASIPTTMTGSMALALSLLLGLIQVPG